MNLYFHPIIKEFALSLPAPLYAVGGYVRNFLIDGSFAEDVDLASPLTVDELLPYLERRRINVVALYKRTGTVVFSADGVKYEFTSFRKDEYLEGGTHAPNKTSFTKDINEDARRRDFKCNAVYYDIAKDELVDPLGGVFDIENKILDTVVAPERVFGHDGLRLMRLARFAAELGFKPTDGVLTAARDNARNIKDISVERIYDELKKILASDEKYGFSRDNGHYIGLKILADTGVLDYIFPELTAGRGMPQRSDYHNYDVLEHSLRTCMYAPKQVRIAALLHDIGKPYCQNEYGKFSRHAEEGARIAEFALKRLKADNKTINSVKFLVGAHMYDLYGDEEEKELRKFIVKNFSVIDSLMQLKQADYSGHKDDLSLYKIVDRWRKVIKELKTDGTPMRLKDLAITARDLKELGVKDANLGKNLDVLWDAAIENPSLNEKSKLLSLLKMYIIGH